MYSVDEATSILIGDEALGASSAADRQDAEATL
jgi:hypothetical protein